MAGTRKDAAGPLDLTPAPDDRPRNGEGEWWRYCFSGVSLRVIEQYESSIRTQVEAGQIQRLLQAEPGAKVLDVPCGQGRHVLELAARGLSMTGVDIARHLLDAAQAKAAERHLQVRWEQRDMRDLPWRDEFDAAYCFDASFGFFDDDGNGAFLEAVHRALKPGAPLLIHAFVLDTLLPSLETHEWARVGDILALDERRWDHERGRVEVRSTFIREGRVEEHDMSLRVYTYRELCRLLEDARFAAVRAYDPTTLKPFAGTSQSANFVATKGS